MITRHMRTHVRPPGSPEFNPLAISQLSLSHTSSQLQQSDTVFAESIGLGPPLLGPGGFSPVQPHPFVPSSPMMSAASAATVTANSTATDG